MSGFSGIISTKSSASSLEDTVRKMGEALAHRGRDTEQSLFIENGAFLARHHNAGVYEASTFTSGSKVVVFDGKLYNTESLRRDYSLGPTTNTAELLLLLFEKLGVEVFSQIEGGFAVLFYDMERKYIYLGRDRFATRPLYFSIQDDVFRVGSEIKTILADPEVQRQVNRKFVPQQLLFGCTFGPETLFNDVYKVMPGYFFEGKVDRPLKYKLFFRPEKKKKLPLSPKKYASELWKRLGDSLGQQISKEQTASIRTGLFLSGGVDSSLVALKQHESGIRNSTAISCEYSDDLSSSYDESEIARENAKKCEMDYQSSPTGSEDDLLTLLRQVIWEMEEPTRFFISLPVEKSLESLKGELDCLVTGMYADVFFGTEEQYDMPVVSFRNRLPKAIRNFLRKCSPILNKIPKVRKYLVWQEGNDVDSIREYILRGQRFNRGLEGLTDDLDFDQCGRHIDVLDEAVSGFSGEDRWTAISMIFYIYCWDELFELIGSHKGLDIIHPFKSRELYELSLEMPYKGKLARQYTKPYMRVLAEQKFSQELAYAEKVIFSSPESIWLSKSRELSEFVLGLKNPESKIFKILNAEAIVKVISTYEEQIRTGTLDRETCHLVFSLAGLEIWLETFFES